MKVLHLTGGGDIGGAKTHVHSLLKELSKYIDVKIVSFLPGIFADDARALGINVEVIHTGNFIKDIIRVIQIIKEEKCEIIHSHGAKANVMSVLAGLFIKRPTITTVHSDYKLDYMHSIYKKFSYGVLNTIALRFLNNYIGVSLNFKEMLINRKFMPQKIYTLYNGLDFGLPVKDFSRQEFNQKYNLNLGDDDIIVGTIARLELVKGIDTLLLAAKEVLAQNNKVKFIIAGDGDERKALEKQAVTLGISNSILFPGWINDSYEFMNVVDIFTLTSLSESFPYTILEATRLKKVIISSNVGGIPDLIDSGENGYLFNPGDYKKLSEQILLLVNSAAKRKEIGEKIYIKASTQFSIENMCRSQLNIYNTILAKNSRAYKYDVILSGYYGFRNSGDDAILKAIIDNLRIRKEDITILVLSKTPIETELQYYVDSVNRINIFKIIYNLRKSKLFINGGGNLIQDGTSTRSIIYYLSTIMLAKLMRSKVMVYANGIGPIYNSFNKKLAKLVLNRVDVITLREDSSIKELTKLQITKPKIILTADPALTVEAIKSSEIDEIFLKEGIELSGSFVGFSARICENNLSYDETTIAQIADYMIDIYGIRPVFIPMQAKDLIVIDSIVSKMKGIGHVVRGNYDATAIIGIISRMEMLIGMRLHSLIYAASLGIPVIGLVYDSKIEAFLEYFHQTSAGDIRHLNLDKFIPLIDDVWNNREEIRANLKKVTIQLKEKAFENSRIAIELLESK